MNIMGLFETDKSHSLLLAVDAVQDRDYKQQLSAGAEHALMERLFIRGGFFFPNDNYAFNADIGVRQPLGETTVGIDYAYTPFQKFDSVHRISVRFAL